MALTALLAAGLAFALAAAAAPSASRVLGTGLRVGCEIDGTGISKLYVRPRTCIVYNASRSFAGSLNLHKLHWSRWTAAGATATGVECGFHAACENTKVTVTLSGLKRIRCLRNDYRSFLRITARSAFGTTSRRPRVCPSDESI